ncbi:hypothetical protein FH972_026886 [Carpinus fangiana]|uniref:Major facilitator superfamily (MFS) profile domain-containing protein n=1 Tax=Carpinus fangiana TaxID=176857 RepID=A0A5N6L5A7_9ROSI|nr:hypothetical protein FH972_026886 [Carpinus fangiana]
MAQDEHELTYLDAGQQSSSHQAEDSDVGDMSHEHDDHVDQSDADEDERNEVPHAIQSPVENAVVSKLDHVLLPFLAVFFLVNSLDKSNIGNSETAHFTRDAGLRPEDLNISIALFFGFFVALQPIGAILGRKFGMVRWVPSTMIAWGLCTALNASVSAAWQLYILRMLIGALEAGFYPTTVSYLSLFYTRYEFAKRLGIFYGQSAVAGALGGILSYFIFSAVPPDPHEGDAPYIWKPWQVLFLVEGSLTVMIACAGFVWLPHGPGTAWFLSPKERVAAKSRILLDRHLLERQGADPSADNTRYNVEENQVQETANLLSTTTISSSYASMQSDVGITTSDILSALLDSKVWILLCLNILSAIPASAFSLFLPLVVAGFGFPPNTANLFVAPPFVLGACTLAFFVWWSDKRQERLLPILWGLGILLIGLTGAVFIPHAFVLARYGALCVLMGGSYVASPLTIAWLAGNIHHPGKRAVVLGINGWGNLAGVFSSLLFAPKWGPDYATPFFVTFALVSISFMGFGVFRWVLIQENQSKQINKTQDRDISVKWRILSGIENKWPHLGVDAEDIMSQEAQHVYTL